MLSGDTSSRTRSWSLYTAKKLHVQRHRNRRLLQSPAYRIALAIAEDCHILVVLLGRIENREM